MIETAADTAAHEDPEAGVSAAGAASAAAPAGSGPAEAHGAASDGGDHAHPSDWEYVKVALILAVITGLEVFTYFESVLDWGAFLVPALLFMMVVKFWLVARMFMHLKADGSVLSQLFGGGLALATGVYIVTLLAFNVFG